MATLPGIVWEADGTTYEMLYVSARAMDILGHDPARWVSERNFWEQHLHPNDRPAAVQAVARAVLELSSTTVEYRFQAADGTYREFRDVLRVVDHADGHRHLVGFMVDVTDEASAARQRRLLATIVESAADACYANELDGTILAWNEAAARVYGWGADEVLGRTTYELIDPGQHQYVREWLERVGRGETVGPVDSEQLGRDGRRLTLSVTAAPVRDDAGRVVAVATIARDVAAERRLAAERLALETRLAQAEKLEAIGRMAGGIAHDFNNMLTAILGYAALVATGLEGDALESQRQVLHAAERASDLTRRLLAFARPALVDARPVDVDRALREAFPMVQRLVPERIALALETGAGAFVLIDPVELEQVLLNLVVNAADAIADTGEVTVATSCVGDPASGVASVRLRVADTGSGMDAAVRGRIFDPFFSTKGFGDGTGLGLTTVRTIVARAGGTIELDTRPGRGTTFDVLLPAVEPSAEAEEAAAPVPAAGTGRILVVDDSEVVGSLAARVLADAGYEVRIETRPSEVLAVGAAGIDLVVTDIVMPGMSGPQMVDRLGGGLPVVFMSGYAGDHLAAELRIGPGRLFVPKPFTAAELLAAVASALEATRHRAGGSA